MFRHVTRTEVSRSRWAAFGAAVAVALGSGGAVWVASAAPAAQAFIPVAPCRLLDTRPAPSTVGPRKTPLLAGQTLDTAVRGAVGRCSIPASATSVAFNLTVPNPGAATNITVFRADAARPAAALLSTVAGGGSRSNGGIAQLSSTGHLKIFSSGGPVNVQVDITGYFLPAAVGAQGIQGAQGPAGGSWTTSGRCAGTRQWQLPSCDNVNISLGTAIGAFGITNINGSIYVTSPTSSDLSVYIPSTGVVLDFAGPGTGPMGITTNGTKIYIADNTTSNVTVGDIATATKIGDFPLGVTGTNPIGIAFDGVNIWTANNGSDTVSHGDGLTGGGVALPIGAAPVGIVYANHFVWVANFGTNSVTRIDTTTFVPTTFALPSGALGPTGITFDGVNIWTSNTTSSNLTRIDPTTGAGSNVALPAGALNPRGIVFDGTNIWTANFGSDNVSRHNVAANSGVNIPLPAGATGPNDLTFDGNYIWTANNTSNNISRLVP